MTDEFYDSSDPQNQIKSKMVLKYFGAWKTIMLPRLKNPQDRLAYLDLFSGPGRFEDGTPSTPLGILEAAINDPRLCERLVTLFNDADAKYVAHLRTEIATMNGIGKLKNPPKVTGFRVGSDAIEEIESVSEYPTLFFIDPFGYKGLSLDMVGSAIRNWGCDCIFFFNYNRISPGFSNPLVEPLIDELFGKDRAALLRSKLTDVSPDERRKLILDGLIDGLRQVGGRFVIPFEFKRNSGQRTSHYIVFVSKAFIGYHIMKEVMARLSTDEGTVKNFEYIPSKPPQLRFFFSDFRLYTIDALQVLLVNSCAGRTVSVWDLYEQYTVDTPYTLRNTQDAILGLEADGRVTVDKPREKRIRGATVTLSQDRLITFPEKE